MRVSPPFNKLAIILTISLGLINSAARAQNYLLRQGSFPTGNQPTAMAKGDFNMDGAIDLATANQSANTVSILLAKPDGTFAAKADYPAGRLPTSIVAADFNNDGRLDIAVTNQQDNTVSILLGNGDGSFLPPTSFATGGSSPGSIIAGDFNRDGKPDIALINQNPGSAPSVAVLLGVGDGTFQIPVEYSLTSSYVQPSLVAADFNGDGKVDFATLDGSYAVAVLLGNGDGSFQTPMDYATGFGPSCIAVGDFNGDGKLDLALGDYGDGTFSILLGNGDGAFQAPSTYATMRSPVAIAAADLNGDTKSDLIIGDGSGVVSAYLGNGNGTFQAGVSYTVGGTPTAILLDDFTGDGKLDIATSANYSSSVPGAAVVLVGRGDGSFMSTSQLTFGVVGEPNVAPTATTTAGDFNRDGHQDLATVNQSQNTVAVLLNNGDETFQAHVDYAVGSEPVAVVSADLNRDSHTDLVVVNGNNNFADSVSVLLGNGDGTFRSHVDYPVSGQATSVAVGDFNGDGVPDLAVTNVDLTTVSILLGVGDGTFHAAVDYNSGSRPQSVGVGDFNGDGKLDLAVSNNNASPGTVSILLGNGNGTFQAPTAFAAGQSADALAIADFNGDGKLDLAVTTYSGVAILLGNGNGTFQQPTIGCNVSLSPSIVAADLNGDGKPDLITADGAGTATVCVNNGDGTFLRRSFYAGQSTFGTVVADFDGDGSPDLAVTNSFQGTITLLLNSPIVAFYPSKVVFANEGVGTTSPTQTVTVSNPGSARLAISSIATAGVFAQTNTCGASLVPGANCAVRVTFSPVGTGEDSEVITVVDSAPGSPQSIPLSAMAINGPAATLTPLALTFGAVQVGVTSASVPVTLQNTGNAILTGITVGVTGDFIQTHTCAATLVVGASCAISVKLMPTARGMREGLLTIGSNAATSPNAVSLEGVGLAPVMTLSATSLDFSNQLVGITSAAQNVIVTSAGDLPLTISSVSASGDFAQSNNCNLPLAPESSCTVSVTMTPAAVGTRTGTLAFVSNALAPQPSVALSGTGAYAKPQIIPPLSPAFAFPGSAAFTLTVNGVGFAAASTVEWKGNPRPTTYVNTTQITAAIPASDIATPGTALVSVVNPTPGGGTSNAVPFEIPVSSPTLAFSKRDLTVGVSPLAVAQADLNGDGKPDLIVSNLGSNTVSVFLGHGDGTFQPRVDYATGIGPVEMAVADFNHDGKPDLAVLDSGCPSDGSNCGTPGLSILLGNGDGTFQAALPLDPNDYPIDLVAADFNGDGKVDLAVQQIGVQGAYVALYLGNGDGTFRAGMQFQIGHESYAGLTDIVLGDFNRDGKLDLAVTDSYTSSVAILLGNGDATFQNPIEYPTGTQPTAIAAGDFNGDGILDLATLSGKTGVNTASVLLGNGDGTFQTNVDYGVGNGPTSLAATDLNGDGKLDLAIVDRLDSKVLVLLGNGDGTFLVDQGFPIGLGGGEIVAADFNADGRMDMATANYLDNTASVLMQALPGSQPAASLSASSLTFVSQPVGSISASQTVTLSNAGTAALSFTSVAASGDFAQTNTCATAVAAGGTCTITVTFKPTSSGPRTGALNISDNAYNSPQTVSLSGTGEDFSFAVPSGSSTTASAAPGQTATYTLSVGGEGGLNQPITFTCTGAPSEATCTVSPNPVTPGSSATNVTVTVTTTAPAIGSPRPLPLQPPSSSGREGLWLLTLVLAAIAWSCGRRNPAGVGRWRVSIVSLTLGLWLALVLAGCGGGGSGGGPSPNPGTPGGTYTLTVTGTAGSGASAVSHAVTLKLTVS